MNAPLTTNEDTDMTAPADSIEYAPQCQIEEVWQGSAYQVVSYRAASRDLRGGLEIRWMGAPSDEECTQLVKSLGSETTRKGSRAMFWHVNGSSSRPAKIRAALAILARQNGELHAVVDAEDKGYLYGYVPLGEAPEDYIRGNFAGWEDEVEIIPPNNPQPPPVKIYDVWEERLNTGRKRS